MLRHILLILLSGLLLSCSNNKSVEHNRNETNPHIAADTGVYARFDIFSMKGEGKPDNERYVTVIRLPKTISVRISDADHSYIFVNHGDYWHNHQEYDIGQEACLCEDSPNARILDRFIIKDTVFERRQAVYPDLPHYVDYQVYTRDRRFIIQVGEKPTDEDTSTIFQTMMKELVAHGFVRGCNNDSKTKLFRIYERIATPDTVLYVCFSSGDTIDPAPSSLDVKPMAEFGFRHLNHIPHH